MRRIKSLTPVTISWQLFVLDAVEYAFPLGLISLFSVFPVKNCSLFIFIIFLFPPSLFILDETSSTSSSSQSSSSLSSESSDSGEQEEKKFQNQDNFVPWHLQQKWENGVKVESMGPNIIKDENYISP